MRAIICDLDGTLCLLNGRNPYDGAACANDTLNDAVYRVLSDYRSISHSPTTDNSRDCVVIMCSGRFDTYRSITQDWLDRHQVPYDYLFMRKEGDFRKDSVVKEEILKNQILEIVKDLKNIEFILDDRNQVVDMWRKNGLNCFQVNYGDF